MKITIKDIVKDLNERNIAHKSFVETVDIYQDENRQVYEKLFDELELYPVFDMMYMNDAPFGMTGINDFNSIRFEGANSRLFQKASRTALSLRLGLYMHEIKRRLDQPICFELLPTIDFETIPELPDQALAHWLRNQLFSGSGIHSSSPGT